MTKQEMSNTLKYIRDYTEDYLVCDYEVPEKDIKTDKGLCSTLYDIFLKEYGHEIRRKPEYMAFQSWAQGLAMGGLFCFWYNRNAKDDLKTITGKSIRRSESECEIALTNYIYTAIIKNK